MTDNERMQAQERELAEIISAAPQIVDELLLYAKGYADGKKDKAAQQSA